MKHTYTITVIGKVQGVNYRRHCKEKATELNISGTVENLPDRNVAIIATGEKEQLEVLIKWCKQGSPNAKVEQLVIGEIPIEDFTGFYIIR